MVDCCKVFVQALSFHILWRFVNLEHWWRYVWQGGDMSRWYVGPEEETYAQRSSDMSRRAVTQTVIVEISDLLLAPHITPPPTPHCCTKTKWLEDFTLEVEHNGPCISVQTTRTKWSRPWEGKTWGLFKQANFPLGSVNIDVLRWAPREGGVRCHAVTWITRRVCGHSKSNCVYRS